MKGKKYSAAEAHFSKLIANRDREIKRLNDKVESLRSEVSSRDMKISTLEEENRKLQDWVDRLLEYTELSKEDIKSACEKDISRSEALNSLVNLLSGMSRYI